jgi:asparagine synthase (glutamine-hydrolysing)
LEFLHTGYTTGQSTLLTEIKQLGAGEYLWIHNTGVKTGFYQRYLTEDLSSPDPNILENGLRQLLKEVFSTLVEKLQGRTAIIPLSGGYDSRLIVYWLYQLKYPDIICVTYGRTNNIEIENAPKNSPKARIAVAFYRLHPTPHNKNTLTQKAFIIITHTWQTIPPCSFMQDFFAVKYLKENNIIPSDAVFIPGHSGDFFGREPFKQKVRQTGCKMNTWLKKYLINITIWLI